MTARARVDHNFGIDGVDIWLGEKVPDGSIVYLAGQMQTEFVRHNQGVTATREPTMRLPEPVARALLDALAAHFGGVSEAQTLRQDYIAERARVDKMIDHLTRDRI